MDKFPQNIIEQYLKTSVRLKKFERIVFKRFAPNVSEVLSEFSSLAKKFEDAGIYQYAAMCHLGVAKCENSNANTVNECHAYLRAARSFRLAMNTSENLSFRTSQNQYNEGAIRCYTQAVQRCPDDVLRCAIIREMKPAFEGTSSFSSPGHRIFELELSAHECLQKNDFMEALQQLEEITDDIYERKKQLLYEDLLKRVEILRLLLIIALRLPPARQSPSHIKLTEYYYQLGNFELFEEESNNCNNSIQGASLSLDIKYALGEIVVLSFEDKRSELKLALQQFMSDFSSLNAAHCFVINSICNKIN
ncbi:uncharacterized protein LOC119669484 [Teleopsis dalmanni]|uniref:uncharacterized protein LOC119669484 n=1 Tax=Teleopsis dalmanni TaxID=139649 RepID=UPI0018CDD339|nr:uncharacterized protein LOC119669484 [Teleopsis dalmanni]